MEGKRTRFVLGLHVLQNPDGIPECKINWYNDGVPTEMLITQLRALIRQYENAFFDEFDRTSKPHA